MAVDVASMIAGTSVMAGLVREYPWATTEVGPIEAWPETLVGQVNVLLHLPYPANLSWGEGLIFFYNDAAIETVGFRHGTALGQPFRELFGEVWDHIGKDFEDCHLRGKAVTRENVLVPFRRGEDLEDRYWNYFLTPVHQASRVAGVLQIFQDRTEAVMSRLRMVRERADLLDLFEQAPAAMTLLDGPGHVYTMANRAHEAMLGKRSYVGNRVADVLPEAEAQGFVSMLDEVYRTGKPFSANNARIKLERVPGEEPEEVYLDFICVPRRDVDGQVCGMVTMAIDVTERRHVTQALIESEKVAAVGRLASSIAHEINNPLATAMNYLYLAETTERVDEVREFLAIANLELNRVSTISNETLLSQKKAMTLTTVTFQDLAESTLTLYQGLIRSGEVAVETRYRMQEALMCVEGELRQVISNLIANAIDAMGPGGGRLMVRACKGCDWMAGHTVHKLTIADDGGGISTKALKEIFKPFFTTRGYKGNGLGLWVCQEIVQRHGGRIAVRSTVGRGSVFTLYLPYALAKD